MCLSGNFTHLVTAVQFIISWFKIPSLLSQDVGCHGNDITEWNIPVLGHVSATLTNINLNCKILHQRTH